MSQFPSNIELSSLNGTNGFRLSGAASDNSGVSVASAGDVNGDGFDDLIIGASGAHANGIFSGASYVVFGKASGFASNINLSSLDGITGFRLSGAAATDGSGGSVASAGDVNGDGFDDLIIGTHGSYWNSYRSEASHVVFGKAGGFASNIDLSSLDGTNGFTLSTPGVYDQSGRSVASAGDVNGDGFDDMIVGAGGAAPAASYVVFGKAGGFAPHIDLSSVDGTTGFKLSGASPGDAAGWSVAAAGDVNGDGLGDLIVGAPSGAGASYVVFGKASGFASDIGLSSLDGTTGFRIGGVAAGDFSGGSVASAGDVNGDGFADLIVGAPQADPNGNYSGASYVVFGKATGFASNIDLSSLDGSNGFRLSGAAAGDRSGVSVASAGDVNDDGFADLIIGAFRAQPHGEASGASYVVFGKASGFASNINLSSLDGSNGVKLSGVAAFDQSGTSVASAGDINGDGIADLIVGAPTASPNGNNSGASYVVFGPQPGSAVTYIGTPDADKTSGGSFDDTLIGLGGDDRLYGNGGRDTLIGGDDNDTLKGGAGNDQMGGGAGNDVLDGGTGDDLMGGGDGDDTYDVDSGDDAVTEFAGEGTDTVHTTASFALGKHVENLIADSDAGLTLTGNGLANSIAGGGGNDRLAGGGNADTLDGGDGNDTLNGGGGADAMDGGGGDDKYYVDNAGDTLSDSSGTDSVHATIDHVLGADFERLYASSDAGLALTGNAGANTIGGRGGADTITGGGGRDVMSGGGGGDTFVFQALSDSVTGGARDLIKDFAAGVDEIDLAAIDANAGLASDQAFSFIGNAAFSHTAGELQVKTLGANTLVAGDVDGNGAADFQILLSGSVALQATDFFL